MISGATSTQVVNGGWAPTAIFTAPHAGSFTIKVKATLPNGSTQWSDPYQWTVALITGWASPQVVGGGKTNFGVSFSVPGTKFQWQYYDVAKGTWTWIGTPNVPTDSNWATFTAPHLGQFTIRVTATTPDGSLSQTSDYPWTVDKIIAGWASPQVVGGGKTNFGVVFNVSGTKFLWQYYDVAKGTWNWIGTPNVPTDSNWATFSAPHTGTYWIWVRAIAPDGTSEEQQQTYTWTA